MTSLDLQIYWSEVIGIGIISMLLGLILIYKARQKETINLQLISLALLHYACMSVVAISSGSIFWLLPDDIWILPILQSNGFTLGWIFGYMYIIYLLHHTLNGCIYQTSLKLCIFHGINVVVMIAST